MFRGFTVEEGEDFETVVQQFEPELSNEYRGVSPRKLIPGTQVEMSGVMLTYIQRMVGPRSAAIQSNCSHLRNI